MSTSQDCKNETSSILAQWKGVVSSRKEEML